MARTRTQIRTEVGKRVGKYDGGTAAVASTTSTIVDTALSVYPDGYWAGKWAYISAGSNAGNRYYITAFTQSSGTCTVQPTASLQFDNATYELYECDPLWIHDGINQTLKMEYPSLSRTLVDSSVVGGSYIFNAGFEYWDSATVPTGWAATTTTISRERNSANVAIGDSALKLGTAAGYVSVSAPYTTDLLELRGYSVILRYWVLANNASNARVAIVDSGTPTYSSYHSGGGGWELLSVTKTISSTATSVNFRLYIDTTNAAYFDSGWTEGGPITRRVRLPSAFWPRGPSYVYLSGIANNTDPILDTSRRLITLPGWTMLKEDAESADRTWMTLIFNAVPVVYRLVIVGNAPLTIPTADTDNIEVDYASSENLILELATSLRVLDRIIATRPELAQSLLARRSQLAAELDVARKRHRRIHVAQLQL